MELRHLRYFVAVATEENVTRASTQLRVAQPSLSRQIRDLEFELGVELFARNPRSIRLTPAGRAFLAEAQAILRQIDEAVERVRAVAEGSIGELHLGFAPSLTVEIVPNALRAFSQRMPGVRVHLHDLSTREMLVGLREGALDVAVLVYPARKSLRGLRFEELTRFAASVAVNKEHRFAALESVSIADLAAESLIAYSRGEYPEYHDWINAHFAPVKRRPRIVEEHDSSTSLLAAVEAGHGVAIVQSGLQSFSGERIRVIPIGEGALPLLIGVAFREGVLPLVAEKMVELLRQFRKE